MLEGGCVVAPLGLDLSQPDQRLDIIRVTLECGTETSFRLGQAALQLQDHAQPLLSLGRGRHLGRQSQKLEPGLFEITPIDGLLSMFTDLLIPRGLLRGRLAAVEAMAQHRSNCIRPEPRAAKAKPTTWRYTPGAAW